jgi:hypothetical protein
MSNDDFKKEGHTDYSPDAVLARIKNKQEETSEPIQIPGWVVLLVLLIVGTVGYYWFQGLGVPDIPLCVVNTATDTPYEIRLDGKSLGLAHKMINEDPKAPVMSVLKIGEHELEAVDASGTVLAHQKLNVSKEARGYLWTPLPDLKFRFLLQTTRYGQSACPDTFEVLECESPLTQFPQWVTQWFHDNPKSVLVKKGYKSDFERALRRAQNDT